MIYVGLVLQLLWAILVYCWTRSVGRQMEAMRDHIARLTASDMEKDKQLSDIWSINQELSATVYDRDYRAKTSTPKPRRKK